jgi:hypothetical protein
MDTKIKMIKKLERQIAKELEIIKHQNSRARR